MKAITLVIASFLMSTMLTISEPVFAQKNPHSIDWSGIKPTGSITLDNLVMRIKGVYDKIFLMDALYNQILNQLTGTGQVTSIDKLIEQIEQFTKEINNIGDLGGSFVDMISDNNLLESIKKEIPILKYPRALKNTATALKAARIIVEKVKGLVTNITDLKKKANEVKLTEQTV